MTGPALALVAMALFAVSTLALRQALRGLSALQVISVELAVQAVLAWAVLWLARDPVRSFAPAVGWAALAGVLGVVGAWAYARSLETWTTGLTSAVAAMYPVIVLVGAWGLFNEPLSARMLVAVVLAVAAAGLAWSS